MGCISLAGERARLRGRGRRLLGVVLGQSGAAEAGFERVTSGEHQALWQGPPCRRGAIAAGAIPGGVDPAEFAVREPGPDPRNYGLSILVGRGRRCAQWRSERKRERDMRRNLRGSLQIAPARATP